jgi:hypothetical protein
MLLGTRVQFPPPPLFLNMRQLAPDGVMRRLSSLVATELRRKITGMNSAK